MSKPAVSKIPRACQVEALEDRRLLSVSIDVVSTSLTGTGQGDPFAVDAGGNFYGVTQNSGPFGDGSVFRFNPHTNSLWTLVTFDGKDGEQPNGVIRDPAGNLFGTTAGGGLYGQGTVFKISAGSNKLTTLVNFNGVDGHAPESNLTMDAQGNLFGSTSAGDFGAPDSLGTIFEVSAGTGKLTTLKTFTTVDLNQVSELLPDNQGNLYGTSPQGGVPPAGHILNDVPTLFKLNISSKKFTIVESLPPGTGAGNLILDSAGNIFGLTGEDISDASVVINFGTIFELQPTTGKFSTFATFGTDGGFPEDLVRDAAGNFYGLEGILGSNNDEIFRVDARTRLITVIATFPTDASNDPLYWSQSALTVDADGNFYGTAAPFLPDPKVSALIFRITGTGFVVPTVDIKAPAGQSATVNVPSLFSLGSFKQDSATGPYTLLVSWGDGSPSNRFTVGAAGVLPAYGHRFHTRGIFKVTLTVTDLLGHTDEASFKISVG